MIAAAFAGGAAGFGVLMRVYGHRIAGVFSKKHRPRPKRHVLSSSVKTTSDIGRGTAHGVTVRPDRGSFRDPLSRVFVDGERSGGA